MIANPDQGLKKRIETTPLKSAKKLRIPEADWMKHLDEKGWAVVPNVLSAERCNYYQEKMYDMLESFEGSGFSRSDPSSWKKSLPPGVHGLLQHQNVGQVPFAWEARCEPTVLKVFSELWNCLPEDLLVSFDAMNFSPPISSNAHPKPWKHFDQGRRAPGQKICVQGCLQISQCNGGTSVISRSHLKHAEFVMQPGVGEDKRNWVKLREEDYAFFDDCVVENPEIPMGSLMLWDSRTAHDAHLPTDAVRMCIYVCYLPREKATLKQLLKKQEVFSKRRMTTHWPFGDRMFPEYFRFLSAAQRRIFTIRDPIKDSDMSPLAWRLAGF